MCVWEEGVRGCVGTYKSVGLCGGSECVIAIYGRSECSQVYRIIAVLLPRLRLAVAL